MGQLGRERSSEPAWPAVTLQTGPSSPPTFVCIGVSRLLVPDLATSQCVGSVLSEEGDDMAAGGSQGGVQRGRDAELNHRPVRMGRRGSERKNSSCPTGRSWGCSEMTGDKRKAWDDMMSRQGRLSL